MSEQVQQFTPDPYLIKQTAPPQELKLDEKFKNMRIVTPIGRLSYANLVHPKPVQPGNPPIYSATLLMHPQSCGDLWRAICMVADERWPNEQVPNPQQLGAFMQVRGAQLLQMTKEQGGIHNPLRVGDQIWAKDPKKYGSYRGLYALNMGIAATNKNGQSQQPPIFNEEGKKVSPDVAYSGCYARAHITIFAFPAPGKQIPNRGVGIMLNSIQFAKHGEKLAGYDAEGAASQAFAAAGALPVESPADPGYGPNFGGGFVAPAQGQPQGYPQQPPAGPAAWPQQGQPAPQGYPQQPPAGPAGWPQQ